MWNEHLALESVFNRIKKKANLIQANKKSSLKANDGKARCIQ